MNANNKREYFDDKEDADACVKWLAENGIEAEAAEVTSTPNRQWYVEYPPFAIERRVAP